MKKTISLLLSIIIIISISNISIVSTSATVVGDDYPSEYKNAAQDTIIDKWNFWNRECTSFVAWRMDSQNGIHDFNNTHLTVNGKYYSVYLGNAYNWGSALQSVGFSVNTTPAVGSIAWTSNGQYGHVAWVAEVRGDNVTVEEYNVYPNLGAYNYPLRTMTVGEWINSGYKFIHVKDLKCTEHKWDNGVVTKEPTCKKDGEIIYTCTVCGEKKTEIIEHSSKYHSYKVSNCLKATLHTNGKLIKKCEHCGKKIKSTIYRPKTIKLKKKILTYNGKKRKPAFIVKNTKGKTISSKYYNTTYSNNKKVGKATAKIKFKTRYSGTVKRYFVIKPKGTSITKLSAGVKAFTAKWEKKATQTTGYQLQYATNSKFTKGKKTVTIKSNKTTSKKISKLKANKKYYVRIRTYKKVNGLPYYSSWSKKKSIKTVGKWYSLYKNFILNKKYMTAKTGHGRSADSYDYNVELEKYADYTIVNFRLIDFNRDGTPELVAYSGFTDFSYPMMHIYTVKNGKMVYCDRFWGSTELCYTTNSKYKGVFYSGGRQGSYGTYYFNITKKFKSVTKNVASDVIKDYYDWSKGFNTTIYDATLYNVYIESTNPSSSGAAYDRIPKKKIPYYNFTQIKNMGWSSFVNEYN